MEAWGERQMTSSEQWFVICCEISQKFSEKAAIKKVPVVQKLIDN